MAHFAQLNSENTVIQVIVVNNDIINVGDVEDETLGINFCKSLFGENTIWKQTSYNGNIRYNFAQIGSTYDPDNDVFINEQPYESWVLNTTTWIWDAPTPYPDDGNVYIWNEETLSWDLLVFE